MTNLQTILTERESQYGSFADFAGKLTDLQNQFKNFENYKHLTNGNRIAIEMILFKCCRLLNGNQDHKDTWLDIGGYASLIDTQKISTYSYNNRFKYTKNKDIANVLIFLSVFIHSGFKSYIDDLIQFAQWRAEQC